MRFSIDKQTINDLELFEKARGEKSVFSLFNFTQSYGGRKQLEIWFSNPLTDVELINQRMEIISYFQDNIPCFEVDKEALDFIEYYLVQQNVPSGFSFMNSLLKAMSNKLKPKNEYYIIQRGIRLLTNTLQNLYDFAKTNGTNNAPNYIINCNKLIINNIEKTLLQTVLKLKKGKTIGLLKNNKLDFYFRKPELLVVKELLGIIYEFDAYKSIAHAGNFHEFSLPNFTQQPNHLYVQGIFHPFLEYPVANDLEFKPETNICFLTGPNMAGKSTFLKSLGIAVYLSHLGFPVPAKSFSTSIFNGLLTTINLSDNINKGYSHFYSEVKRVKYVAEQINQVGNIFVVFDELFRGTNVKDAYEASLSVITAFSKLNRGIFAISTHIIEVADKLKDRDSIFFNYFEANLVNNVPNYNYQLKEGVTDERIGMYILNQEKVIETIEKSI
jgi:DNA mismatch repair protein MutS